MCGYSNECYRCSYTTQLVAMGRLCLYSNNYIAGPVDKLYSCFSSSLKAGIIGSLIRTAQEQGGDGCDWR